MLRIEEISRSFFQFVDTMHEIQIVFSSLGQLKWETLPAIDTGSSLLSSGLSIDYIASN